MTFDFDRETDSKEFILVSMWLRTVIGVLPLVSPLDPGLVRDGTICLVDDPCLRLDHVSWSRSK